MEIETITENNIIDTTKEENINKYKNNLNILINRIKEKGCIDKFVIIRNDDYFPKDFKWKVNSKYTNGEYRTFLRYHKEITSNKKGFFLFSNKEEVKYINEELKLFYPLEFRSTKHFTVNTALSTTGEYNFVPCNRTYTIIDDINNFLESGYGYSLSDKDAYLDVTHEPLEISKNAIILISVDTYNKIKENKELMKQLVSRKIVIYKGDLTLATNMVLTENGILPIRTEYKYDSDLKEIINNSLENLCLKNNLEYNRPHGFGGHFTSYIDQYEESSKLLITDFINYINNVLGNKLIDINSINSFKDQAWNEYVDEIGLDKFKTILNDFNKIQIEQLEQRKIKYESDKLNITPQISNLFKETIKLIKENEFEINFTSDYNDLTKKVIKFYLSPDVNSQVEAALELKGYFNENKKQY